MPGKPAKRRCVVAAVFDRVVVHDRDRQLESSQRIVKKHIDLFFKTRFHAGMSDSNCIFVPTISGSMALLSARNGAPGNTFTMQNVPTLLLPDFVSP